MMKHAGLVAALTSVLAGVTVLSAVGGRSADNTRAAAGLTIHEWGTFTSVAGPDGKSSEWLPLNGATTLPSFVTLMNPNSIKSGREGLRAMVRMETPVLYFYSPQNQTVDVSVKFPHGAITEWYPSATVTQPEMWHMADGTGSIEWNNVKILPNAKPAFPVSPGGSHYYAARATDAAPVQVGLQSEKFLFYRGLADFQVPVAAMRTKQGNVVVQNLGKAAIPALIFFEARDGRMGYRVIREFRDQTTLDPPTLNSDFESLRSELEDVLVAQGLYTLEAKAMIETWHDTWFEPGTRLFYIMPKKAVDSILPLDIRPQPGQVSRAFVGRLEIITPDVEDEVERAIMENDQTTIKNHARFMEPIARAILARTPDDADSPRTQRIKCFMSQPLVAQAGNCR